MRAEYASPLYIIRGAIFVWSHKVLWKYAAAPIIISIAVLIGSYALLYDVVLRIFSPYRTEEWYDQILYYLVIIVLTLSLLAVSLFILARLASTIAAPFNDIISQKTEEISAGIFHESPFSLSRFLRDSMRLLGHAFRILGLYLILLILGLLLLLIPVIGGVLYTFFGILVSAYMFAYEYLGYPMDRRRYSWQEKRRFLRSKVTSILGFGLGTLAIASIPIVNFLFIPAAVAGGTLFFLDLSTDPKNTGSIVNTKS